MYEQFYGLTERPFDLTPNWRYFYLTPMHRETLSAIQYGVTARRGIVVVTGEAGTGKTTIVRAALRALRTERVRQVSLNNPMLTRAEFLRFLAKAFRLRPDAAEDKVALLTQLTASLARYHSKGRPVVLVVDEAQSMPHELLEEIRLLANIETSTAKLLQVVLAGQPELAARLNDPSLRQLKQRVAIRATLRPLDLRATASMIAGRIRVAGGRPADVFTPQAVEAVFAHSGGVARTVNVICDNALLSGFAAEQRPIGRDIIEEVCRDFDLPRLEAPVTAASMPAAADTPARVAPEPSTMPAAADAAGAASQSAAGPSPARRGASPVSDTAPVADLPSPVDGNDMFSTFRAKRRFFFPNWVR